MCVCVYIYARARAHKYIHTYISNYVSTKIRQLLEENIVNSKAEAVKGVEKVRVRRWDVGCESGIFDAELDLSFSRRVIK